MTLDFARRYTQVLAGTAALLVLLSAVFLPWHEIISGDEQLAPQRMPQTRQEVAQAKANFDRANARYQDYIKTHDLGGLHDKVLSVLSAITESGTAPAASQQDNATVKDLGGLVRDYAFVLYDYSSASDAYLQVLQGYDDDLMSWTRGLLGASESLRSQTWPFVEHIKLYPQPVGLKTDPPMVNAAQVQAQIDSLDSDLGALNTNGDSRAALNGIKRDIDGIWASGRSVEYIAGLHAEYHDDLATYDSKVAIAAQDPHAATPVSVRPVFAWGLTLIISALTLGGLVALFMPRLRTETAA
jgi:hypothetical protein